REGQPGADGGPVDGADDRDLAFADRLQGVADQLVWIHDLARDAVGGCGPAFRSAPAMKARVPAAVKIAQLTSRRSLSPSKVAVISAIASKSTAFTGGRS